MGISSRPDCAGLYKIGGIFRGNVKFDLEVLSVQADFEEIAHVWKVSAPKQERGRIGCVS